ncbi:ABC-2 transporter permease [Aneurinibacillus aneurinilyticus]|uniref:ABC-2 transporter permease n=1 Tax=Aneurinibacillus aneurinilyticus TaxID=1391 RepID=UPI0023F46545|nr:ABC-2 transporter permease [Aneurinibacillus aneurinilyticus]MCI1696393.1 ABC-2 transporter permease [Aneurinibacillus aneurinilyticus]
MFNLILKDILIQKKIIIVYVATLLLYLLLNISPVFIGFIYSIVFIMTAYSYDEKDNINILLNSLPYTRKEIVSSKYIGALIFTSLFVIVIFVGDLVVNGNAALFSWKETLLIFGLVMVTTAFILPFSYKFKSQYLLIASAVLFGLYILAISFFFRNLNDRLRELIQEFMTLQEIQFYFLAILMILILYIASWLLSIRIYERKVF